MRIMVSNCDTIAKQKIFRQLLNCIKCNKNNFCILQQRFWCGYLSTSLSSDFKIAWHVQTFEFFDFSRSYTESWVSEWSRSVVSDSLRLRGCSLPGFSVHGILQARILEWVTISFSNWILILSKMIHQGVYSFLMRLTQSNSGCLCFSYSFWRLLFYQTKHL